MASSGVVCVFMTVFLSLSLTEGKLGGQGKSSCLFVCLHDSGTCTLVPEGLASDTSLGTRLEIAAFRHIMVLHCWGRGCTNIDTKKVCYTDVIIQF